MAFISKQSIDVSTHSHPKVAAYPPQAFLTPCVSFNTQPPEGGCKRGDKWRVEIYKFQHTATRRWLPSATAFINSSSLFQHTATRRWLHQCDHLVPLATPVSTHSHPKVAALMAHWQAALRIPFQHTATRRWLQTLLNRLNWQAKCFNTQPPEGGCPGGSAIGCKFIMFQHTATRRWLQAKRSSFTQSISVSTHSHPKVAAKFNLDDFSVKEFQHTATRRWLLIIAAFIY